MILINRRVAALPTTRLSFALRTDVVTSRELYRTLRRRAGLDRFDARYLVTAAVLTSPTIDRSVR